MLIDKVNKEDAMSQPSFIQYAYLDFKDDEAVDNFYFALKEEVEAYPRLLTLQIFKERNPSLQNEIIEILDAWHTHTIRKKGIDKLLQKHRPTLVFCAVGGDELSAEEFYHSRLENTDTQGLLFELIIKAMLEEKEIQKCAAEDCDKYFMPVGPNAWRMKYCSERCRLREAQKRYRQRKKNE